MQIFRFLSVSVKFTKFLMSFMEPKVIFSSKFPSILSLMTHNSLYFFSSNIIYFGQKGPFKVQILRLSNVGSRFFKFFMSFFKAQVSSLSYFASLSSVMIRNSSVIFWLKHNIRLTKVAHKSANCQTCHRSH